MRILADRHHMSLTESLILLFEKRLGHELYFQKGMEWWNEGLWDVYHHPSTAQQYLERELEGVKGIDFETFKNIKFDILICSIPQHVPIWLKLKQLYQPSAKLIFQVGNMWAFNSSFPIKNIMASAVMPELPGFNQITYHQEFDLNIFHYQPVKPGKKIYSFINCLNTEELYKKDWELFLELERLMSDWEFKSFGGQCRDGAIWDRKELADKMREATFIFHCKTNGDGYGHVIHSAAAVGRPLITRFSDYKGKLAEPLINHGSATLIDNKNPQEIVDQIQYDFENKIVLQGYGIYQLFKHNVDFDKEAEQVKLFLKRLQSS